MATGRVERRLAAILAADPAPTVAAVIHDLSKGMSPELAARIAEGLRKAGLPEG